MTITQLKRHMDRRFDRLERMKVDKVQLRGFATRKDLRRFATKAELRREIRAVRREMRLWAIDIKHHFNVNY